ncbi:NAD(P)-dependent dehydrogenase (short-subunit alcohol dehydrogenase family) [Actinocorallia herbida]|uniref:NAD(P)-dependent dehydrogenase (Short-subunit alcohol dehydrogenase family) n=1 Tax=Actinocorallia herbida TaxID=58109 RepID=A0A3N1D3N5_9ACTN|nr:SDR family NAD(P)-dependent oxidoreductase [Actinocorallia herbida]ROO88131.1 NAD(P)-dependent dehydrogenase (short-subunit alcohol dehydrogenase family) [Actinocorallia herbida]
MRTHVITGGTDGMGKGLALKFLARGDRVFALASGQAKGAALLAEAARLGAADRAVFVRADLATVAGMRKALAEVTDQTDVVDGLVFGAQRFASKRIETVDGLEFTFALFYLSRYVLGHGLLPALERADAPVVMNLAGPGGLPGTIYWDDLQLTSGYQGRRAAMQGSRCVDLLGAAFPLRHPDARTRYVLYNPGFVRTGMADPLPPAFKLLTKTLGLVAAQSVDRAIGPIAALIDSPPAEPLSAFMRAKRLPLEGDDFAPDRALRLDSLTARLLDGL